MTDGWEPPASGADDAEPLGTQDAGDEPGDIGQGHHRDPADPVENVTEHAMAPSERYDDLLVDRLPLRHEVVLDTQNTDHAEHALVGEHSPGPEGQEGFDLDATVAPLPVLDDGAVADGSALIDDAEGPPAATVRTGGWEPPPTAAGVLGLVLVVEEVSVVVDAADVSSVWAGASAVEPVPGFCDPGLLLTDQGRDG